MISPVTFIGQEVFVPITDKIVPQNINNTTIRTAERILYRMSNTKISQNYDF